MPRYVDVTRRITSGNIRDERGQALRHQYTERFNNLTIGGIGVAITLVAAFVVVAIIVVLSPAPNPMEQPHAANRPDAVSSRAR